MAIHIVQKSNYKCLHVRVMVGGKPRFKSFSLRKIHATAKEHKAMTDKIWAEAEAKDAEWLAEQQALKQEVHTTAHKSTRNRTTPVRGISASVYSKKRANAVNAGVYWRFQIGAHLAGTQTFKSRSVAVNAGDEKEAWIKACTILAEIKGTEPDPYIRRWPGTKKMRAVFANLERENAGLPNR